MLILDSSLCNLRVMQAQKGVEIVVSLFVLDWALPLLDGVDNWDPSHCGMTARELIQIDEAHLARYLLELISNWLVWDPGIR